VIGRSTYNLSRKGRERYSRYGEEHPRLYLFGHEVRLPNQECAPFFEQMVDDQRAKLVAEEKAWREQRDAMTDEELREAAAQSWLVTT
jgi:hypothetical protein